MPRVAVATTSQLAADAAAEVADAGGNAVDCAVAAAIFSVNTEPGVCALAGSAYVTVWPPDSDPITIDGNVTVPGKGLAPGFTISGAVPVSMDYGGGIETLVGPGSVAVPGSLAALDRAWQQFGKVGWQRLLDPAIRAARTGFPLSAACHYYLQYSGEVVFGRSEDGDTALHEADGALRDVRSNIVVPHLADSLTAIASEGSRIFYEGEIASRIVDHVRNSGGALTLEDLQSYKPIMRPSLCSDLGAWRIATNPPPAVGGAVLAAMLLAFQDKPVSQWNDETLRYLVSVQRAALSYRKIHLDLAEDVAGEVAKLLEQVRSGQLLSQYSSASTVHTSVVDDTGMACAITASSGYGSGEMPAGTGLWLNNCLGELELNRKGLEAGPPGKRLPSNMAPGVARTGHQVLAMGSPGADRITTALHQFLVNFLQIGLPLADAVAHPRAHLEISDDGMNLAVEPGLDMPELGIPVTLYPSISMYFGGVGAAHFDAQAGFEVAADPRREGGTFTSG
ncbi:MAG: gamma-glutamyltransferase [Gammaproteobacteria bacterium]|nr:MAG: gamma-glutamyltransferase [Gammaproteobacteria bacterium]